jgi:homoserine kinase type II
VAVYTDITDGELAGLLAGYDLGEPRAFKGIAEGIENSNFLLETDVGRYILTVYERRVAEADLPFFLQLMQHLARRGFPCPTPQPDRRGRLLARVRDKPAAIVSFLPGVSARRPNRASAARPARVSPASTSPPRALACRAPTAWASPPGARSSPACAAPPSD